jgi:hypothetical protein
MAYYINLFSPDTHEAFSNTDKTISGFTDRRKKVAAGVMPGDKLICYVTKLSRWAGILEVKDQYFISDQPIYAPVNDPYIVRFKVHPSVWLPLENAIPVIEEICWDHLTSTSQLPKGSNAWTGIVRTSLRKIKDEDGAYLERILKNQLTALVEYPLGEDEKRKIKTATVKTQDNKQLIVSIPDNEESNTATVIQQQNIQRESIKMQALLAKIGERMNMKIWLPRSDKQRVLEIWSPKDKTLLENLPLNYDDVTLKTIENIDVLWIKGRSIIRAFEVEHTTSIYSGILRMADLMALQPNLNISAHIVAPIERKAKVIQEISRPVFTLLERGPLSEACTFISYESIRELSEEKNLEHMADTVLEEYEEYAAESGL